MRYFFTDGGATINDKSAKKNFSGFAFLEIDTEKRKVYGHYTSCPIGTNNQMEMRAVLEVLKLLSNNEECIIFCDSTYVIKGITEWSIGWESRNYAKVENADIWKQIMSIRALKDTGFIKVKGHSTSKFNIEVDSLVGKARELSKSNPNEEIKMEITRDLTDEDVIELAKDYNSTLVLARVAQKEEMGF